MTHPPAKIDVIVIPASRQVNCLREAIQLARELDSQVVALCSRSATAREAAAVGTELDARVIAIDVGGLGGRLPLLDTSRLLTERRFRHFQRGSDLSVKRNLGLLLARVAGWERVLFLDDDITGVSLPELRAAAGLLPRYRVIGLRNQGFPDNSVVCHAYRRAGGAQDAFIGGGAMLVAPANVDAFFPNVYNEDWFFFYDALLARSVAVSGSMVHKEFDPFADPRRARSEEFGDVVAEGLYRLLDDGGDLRLADRDYWRSCLYSRRTLIESVVSRIQDGNDGYRAGRMITSLKAARSMSSFITPTLCVDYLQAWHSDRLWWRDYLGSFELGQEIEDVLSGLGLGSRCMSTSPASRLAR